MAGAVCWLLSPVLTSLCLAASLPFIILTLVNSPYKRGFYCNDDSIRYPYKADTITHGLMAGVTISCTVIIVRNCQPFPPGQGSVVSGSLGPAQPPPELWKGNNTPSLSSALLGGRNSYWGGES